MQKTLLLFACTQQPPRLEWQEFVGTRGLHVSAGLRCAARAMRSIQHRCRCRVGTVPVYLRQAPARGAGEQQQLGAVLFRFAQAVCYVQLLNCCVFTLNIAVLQFDADCRPFLIAGFNAHHLVTNVLVLPTNHRTPGTAVCAGFATA